MHSALLLASKFFQPVLAPNRVTRPHLVQRLEEGLSAGQPVSLISAPAGYGKSTLVAEWISQTKRPVAWLSLEEADDDPLRFFTYFLAALQHVDATLGVELSHALASGQMPPQEVLITTLVNGLAQIKTICLCVLDDFQWIQDGTILTVLQGLVAHQPRQFHLIIATREDPALPLARWRARSQLTEIRAADLRFASAEATTFLREGMGLALSAQDIALLEERTEGWAAGLQLAGISLQGREDPASFVATLSGIHRFILGYLAEEVLKGQPPEVKDFLLQTACLSRLNGELCDAVTTRTNSAALLEKLFTANLFLIPLDDEGHWYRYHHLFADLLRNQLQRTHPQQVAELHLRASRWYESQNMPVEAIDHALAAKDYTRVANLLEQNGWELLNQGLTHQMEAWTRSLPPEWSTHSPRTCLGFAWMHLLRGSFGQASAYLEQAQAALEQQPDAPDLQAECLALQANLYQSQGQIPASIDAARLALQLVAPHNLRVVGVAALALGAALRQVGDFEKAVEALQRAIQASRTSGDQVTEMLAVAHLTLMSLQYGRLRFAAATASQSLERMEHAHTAPPPIVGAVHGALGSIYYEWNQVEEARLHLERGIRLGTFSGHNASVIYTKVNLARLQQAEGHLDAATQTLDEAAELLRQGAPGWARPEWILRKVSLLLAQDNPSAAEALLHQSGSTAGEDITLQTDGLHLAWLRLLYARKDANALSLAMRIVAAAEASQRSGTALQALILGALIQSADLTRSLAWLERAWKLAEPEGYLRIFLDEGAPMAALLRHADHPQLLALFPNEAKAVMGQPRGDELVEALSERELEVLRLLAEGLKYAEIAARLVISVNTVRYHVKSIYGKLSVEKLARAIERARSLGLL